MEILYINRNKASYEDKYVFYDYHINITDGSVKPFPKKPTPKPRPRK